MFVTDIVCQQSEITIQVFNGSIWLLSRYLCFEVLQC